MNIHANGFQLHRITAEIDTGHRLLNHPGKCGSPHGHRYMVEVFASGKDLDTVGVVVDFGVFKAKLGAWINEHWDHTFIFEQGDPLISAMYDDGLRVGLRTDSLVKPHYKTVSPIEGSAVGKDKRPCFILPYAPSAENIARYLFEEVCPALFKDDPIVVDHIKVWETPNCAVVYPSPGSKQRAMEQSLKDLAKRLGQVAEQQRADHETVMGRCTDNSQSIAHAREVAHRVEMVHFGKRGRGDRPDLAMMLTEAEGGGGEHEWVLLYYNSQGGYRAIRKCEKGEDGIMYWNEHDQDVPSDVDFSVVDDNPGLIHRFSGKDGAYLLPADTPALVGAKLPSGC